MARCARAERLAPLTPLVASLSLAGCAGSPSLSTGADAGDVQERYERCDDPEGQRAYEAAVKKIGEREPAQALPLLREALARCPDFLRAHLLYQDTALELVRGPEAERHEAEMRTWYASMPEHPASAVVTYLKARLLDDPSEQLAKLEEVLRKEPRFAPAHVSMARIWRSAGNLDKASAELNLALAQSPRNPDAHLELGEISVQLGQSGAAAVHFADYLRLNPSDRLAKIQHAQLLIYDLGRPAEARPLVEELVSQDPGDVAVLMDLAAIEWKTSNGDKARDVYKRILRLDRTQSRAALNLANLWFEMYTRGTDPQEVAGAYARARKAYLFYRNMRRHDGVLDAIDFHLAVPYRIKWIEDRYPSLALDKSVPTLDDL